MNIESERRQFVRLDGKLSLLRSIIGDNNMKTMYGKMKKIENWRRIVVSACVVALAIDPLFLLIPVIDSERFCFTFDKTVGVIICVLRTFSDTFYAIHIFVHLKIEVNALHSQQNSTSGFRKKELCLLIYLIVDIFSIIPIPQAVVLNLIGRSASLVSKKILKWIIICQYIPRFLRTYPIFKEVIKPSGNIAESKWIGAAINFFLYMLFSYGFGAFWYVNAIEKQSKCWREACKEKLGCKLNLLLCKPGSENNAAFLKETCPIKNATEMLTNSNSASFDFGMFTDALKSGVLERKNKDDFPRKFIYCFRWGLRHLSALGQNLETSSAVGENVFAIVICVSGLLLFAVLIGNVQKYLQASTTRVDARKENKIDTEKWMSKQKLPKDLIDGIRKHADYKWRETRGMEEETLLRSLPKHLTKGIKRHIYRNLITKLKHVPQFLNMDERSLEVLCSRLKTAYYAADTCIVKEDEPVEDMLYIVSGELESTRSGDAILCADYLYGEELFDWAFDPQSSHYPISNRTVKTRTEVEAFILSADDLKFVATQCTPENPRDIMTL